MLNNKLIKRGKKAGVTVELLLSVLLAVVVLFLILGLFSDNLQKMFTKSNMAGLWNNNDQKTAVANRAFDPTQTNVQVLAEQGQTYLKWALDTIDNYKKNPPQDEDGVLELAKAATIARILAGTDGLSQADGSYFAQEYGIIIDKTETFTTTIATAHIGIGDNRTTKVINKQFTYDTSSDQATDPTAESLAAVKKILNAHAPYEDCTTCNNSN